MKRLVNCLDKLVGKLITKADADLLVSEARSYEAEGYSPAEAERMAVSDAVEATESTGQSVLEQIRVNVPQALLDAQEYWGRETIRKVGAPFVKGAPAAPVERPGVPPVELPAAPPAQPEAARPEAAPPLVTPTPEALVEGREAPEALPEAAKEQPPLPGFKEPLTKPQIDIIDALPEGQRAKLEKAFAPNPFPDPHRPLPKKSRTISPEKNKGLAELSKYGVLDPDSTTQGVLEKMAADKSLPRWMRTILDLLTQVGNLGNVEIEAVNLPDSNWPALYQYRGPNQPAKIWINLARNLPPGGLARSIVHEVLHHMTMMKLMGRVPLSDTEAEAKAELLSIFEHIQNLPEFEGEYGALNPWEFASEIFSNEGLRAKLNALSLPGEKVTLMQQIRRLLAKLGFGGKEIRAGSLLEEAMRQTINVAGVRAVEDTTSPMAQVNRERFARVMNEFPQFQNELINATAPILHDMEITPEERKKDWENAHYTEDERIRMDKSLDEALAKKGWKLTPEERAKWDDRIARWVKGVKAYFPQSEGWAQHLITPSKIIPEENKKGERRPMVEFAKAGYTFDHDKGKALKTGSTEWNQRAEDLANQGVEDLQTRIMEGGPEAKVILDQIGWYRSVMDHIRHSYGGMSDLFADLLGTFSPQTQVKQNWEYGIQALKKTMAGDYDELLSRVDKWMKEDPSRTIDEWKALHKKEPEKAMILKENDKLFGQNSIHGMKALLDFWRIVQSGSAPKARNFTANLIGHSYKATIDLWAARFLQRMHLPNFRIPTRVEGDVTGAHMKDVAQISGQFGLGQEVFKRMAARLRTENPTVWGEVSPADLQAIMWYGEKHVWESKGWTRILGASNSMKAMAEAEAVNRYELGLSRDRVEKRVTARDQRTHGMKLRNTLSGITHTVGAKVMDTVSMFQGTKERAWDSEILVYPEYDPQEMIDAVVEVAGTSNQDATHISRVIDTEFEKNNPNARPGITVFFRNQVDLAGVKPVMDELERLGINGFTLQVDSRAKTELRPEVMKKGVPDQFFGIRMQFVPEYYSPEEAAEALPQVIKGIYEARKALQNLPNIAYINEVFYDTLVLKKGQYDTRGKLTDADTIRRADVWRERALSVGAEAKTRRDAVREQIRKTDAEAKRLKREAERAEEERIAELSGGVPEEEFVTAAQAQEYEQEPPIDPVSGRPSMVRDLAQRAADAGGTQIPQGALAPAGVRHAGGRAKPGGARLPSLWQTLGDAFRRRESEVYRSVERAGETIQRLNPGEGKYARSQKLFDYLTHPEKEITDPDLEGDITALRERVPVLKSGALDGFKQLPSGQEAGVFHDGRIVYKVFTVAGGRTGNYIPGRMRLDEDRKIRIEKGPQPSFQQFLARVDNVNNHGKLTPMELVGVMPEGYVVFAQPFVAGQRVKRGQIEESLESLDMKLLTDIGGIAAIGKVGDKYVLFDDLHQDNVHKLPGGRVEIFDAVNRDLTLDETDDLRELEYLPVTAPQDIEPEKGFYSGVAKILNRKMPNAAPPQQVKAIIKDAPQEDIKWSGVNQAIDDLAAAGKGKVNKTDLLNMLDVGGLELEEVTLSEKGLLPEDAQEMSDLLATFDRTPGQQERLAELSRKQNQAERPRFNTGDLILPGGENYREVVLAMPERKQTFEEFLESSSFAKGVRVIEQQSRQYGYDPEERINNLREQVRREFEAGRNIKGVSEYTSSHFPNVPNYVAHARMNDRVDAEGKPGLFLEEIQSDRHQAGREKGYAGEMSTAGWTTEEMGNGIWRVFDKDGNQQGDFRGASEKDAIREAAASAARLDSAIGNMVPDAPFRKDWPVQMFKRALRDAVASGKEWIGWTSGETQADRYSLSKHVDELTYDVGGKILQGYWGGNQVFEKPMVMPEHLPEIIGKEASRRLLEAEFTQDYGGRQFQVLKGEDLNVGGEGMKGFYDKMLPNEIGKYVRQWGGKVEEGSVQTQEPSPSQPGIDEEGRSTLHTPIWKVEITPQMKETIPVKGQSLFGAVAPQVQDDTDVVSNPLAPRGYLTRFLSFITGKKAEGTYETQGYWSAGGDFNDAIQEALRTKVQNGKSYITNAAFLGNEYQRIVRALYPAGMTEAQKKTVNLALGNLENRLTLAQSKQAKSIRDPKLRAQYLDQAERSNIHLQKQQQQAALNSLPAELRDLIVQKRDLINLMNEALINEADISADLKEAIEKNKGTYLHRSYQIFEHNDVWKQRLLDAEKNKDTEAIRVINAAKNLIEKYILKQRVVQHATAMKKAGTPVTRAASIAWAKSLNLDHDVANMLNDYINIGDDPVTGRISLYGGRPTSRGMAIMTERGIVPKEIRELWGEWKDPDVNFAKTYVSLGQFLEADRFQRAVLDDGIANGYVWKEGVSTGKQPLGWKEIAPEGSKTMGVLAGAYGPQLMVDAFAVMNSPTQRDRLTVFLSKAMSWPLAAKTVYSTGSIARNFFGNLAFVMANGNLTGPINKARKTAWADALKSGPTAMREYVKELTALGVLGDNVVPSMLDKMAELAQESGAPITKAKDMAKLWDRAQKAGRKLSEGFKDAYSGVDSFWKVYAFEAELGKLEWAHADELSGLTGPAKDARVSQLKKEAADIVRRTMPTYSEAWSLLKTTSAVGKFFAPFIKFRTEVIRTSIGAAKQGFEEARSDNPRLKKIGTLRLAMSTMTMLLVPATMAFVTKAMFGYDDEEEEAIRTSLPDWQKNATLLLLPKDGEGNPRFLDLSYMNPYSVYNNPVTAALRAYSGRQSIDDALVDTGLEGMREFFRPFLTEQLWLSTVIDIGRNQDSQRNYGPLWNEQDTLENKVSAGINRFVRTLTPGTVDSLDRVWKGVQGEVSKGGKEYSAPNEILAMTFGFRMTTHNTTQALQTLTAQFEAEKGDAQKLFMGPLTNRGTIDPDEVKAGYEQANDRRKALYYRMRQNFLGSQKLGMTTQDAIKTMIIGYGGEARKTGLGKADIQAIVAGKYFRYTPSKPALTEARAKHPDRYQAFMEAYQAAPEWEDIAE